MMRQIKFRAWDLISKKYRYLNADLSSIPYYELFCHTPDNRPFEMEQFTGLVDNYGIDIYEGDILEICGKQRVVVEWNQQNGGFRSEPEIAYCDWGWSETVIDHIDRVKIIGNKWENAELLKGE
jgi:hypothetical protein